VHSKVRIAKFFFPLSHIISCEEKVACKRILEKKGLLGFQVTSLISSQSLSCHMAFYSKFNLL
jgi:hypothetical protein